MLAVIAALNDSCHDGPFVAQAALGGCSDFSEAGKLALAHRRSSTYWSLTCRGTTVFRSMLKPRCKSATLDQMLLRPVTSQLPVGCCRATRRMPEGVLNRNSVQPSGIRSARVTAVMLRLLCS